MSRDGPGGKKGLVPSTPAPMSSQTTRQKRAFEGFVHRQLSAPETKTTAEPQRMKKNPKLQTGKDINKTVTSTITRPRGSVQLEEELTLSQLKRLMRLFKTHRPEQKQHAGLHFFLPKPKEQPGLMNLQDFSRALRRALQLESELANEEVEELFRKVDVSSDGLVDWDELCSYVLLRLREKDCVRSANYNKVFNDPPKIVKIEKSKEPTSRILTVFNPTRYITVSKDGIIRVWNTNLVLQRSIIMEDDDHSLFQRSSIKRHMKMWVTDAVVMENVHKIAVCTTNMDIYFYDMSTPVFTPQFHLCGLGAVSFCMDYHYDQKNPSAQSLLFYGDDKGSVHMLTFHKPLKGLFETPFKKSGGSYTVFLQDLSFHSELVTYMTLDQVHSDWVRRLRYFSSSDILISCSGNGEDTLVVRSVLEKPHEKTYLYKIAKGIDCFDYCKEINIIVTGGMDHIVRLWNPYVTIKPVAILRGHLARVIDVVLHKEMKKVFSYDSDTVLKIWDVKDHYCIQSVHLKYPYNPHHLEHGPFPVVFLPSPANSLLIACDDYLTELKLDDQLINRQHQVSHEKPLCAAVYNPHKKQVITGCEGSIVRTWNVENGKKVFEFKGVLENDEMSCMALEKNGGRLFTGSRNGMVYIWTAGNGNLLHRCTPETGYECEVTAIQTLPERPYTLSVGWSRRIIMYHDDSERFTLPADPSWKGGHVHEDDILCIAHCPPNLLATGSFNGDLILWGLERQNIYRRLKRGSGSLFKSKIKRIGLTGSRKRQKTENKHNIPIDTLLFLEARAQTKEHDDAILVSSQAGTLDFWGMHGQLRPKGSFYAPLESGCIVLALTTTQDNDILVSGDSSGHVAVWDIREYCRMKLEASVAQIWASSHRQIPTDHDVKPPQKCHWRGHTKSVVSLDMVNQSQRGQLVLSASVDCTAKLWTIDGDLIGMFGQAQSWNLKNPSLFLSTKDECREVNDDILSEKIFQTESTNVEVTNTSESDENITKRNKIRPQTCGAVVSQSTSEEKVQKDDQKCPEKLGIDRSLTEWSILGERYNKTFERRMVDRRNRRGNLGYVDTSLTKGGGLGSSCSPFQALHVPTTNEFELPRDLPMTARMKSRSKSSPNETWQKNLTSLNLPPILLKDGDP